MEGFNLENIKKEIEARKSENAIKEQASGRVGTTTESKKKFLVDLLTSVNNGTPTPAVQALRTLNESTEQRYGAVGGIIQQPLQQYAPPQQLTEQYPAQQRPQQQFERGDAYFDQQFDKAADMLRYKSNSNNQQVSTAGLSQTLSEFANAPFVGAPPQNLSGLNPNVLNEQITRTMNEVMGGSQFTKVVSEAYKNMINEMYAKEKIESILVDIIQGETFQKILRKQIISTLVDIQKRNEVKKSS